ncbi:MAG: hypothetical protein KAS78_02395 [Candidatus Pacebacteria bacterium]|nr:hypothetical protein [Candidatus Paceibacterota bacterium]
MYNHLYLFSFRNYGEFHENVTNRIFNDLWKLLKPRCMRICADFNVRGGISIKPMVMKFDSKISQKRQKKIEKTIENYDRRSYFNRN